MKLYRIPYYLILMLATSVAMIFFLKINKKSFYNHYFKGIADIELRNSQALHQFESLSVFQLNEYKPIVLSLFWLGLSAIFLLFLDTLIPARNLAYVSSTSSSSFYKQVYPCRAP